jgi:hypothetical protein
VWHWASRTSRAAERGPRAGARWAAALLAAAFACASLAEPSGDDYRSAQPPPATAAERRRLAEQLEAERRREAHNEALRAAAAASEAARREAELAARPPGERLVEARCSGCHTLAVVDLASHGSLGWRLVIERMRWWHGAALAPGEAAQISAHLRASRPARAARIAIEFGLATAALLALVAAAAWFAGRGFRMLRQRRARRAGGNSMEQLP